ncbi:MAG: hypothetical protein RLZZ29_1768, partial [Cyanobacteriota bacterium]
MNKWLLRWTFSLLLAFGVAFIWGFGYFVPSAIALTQQQKLVAEAWRIVNRSYIDATFNNQNWERVRQGAFKQPLGNDQAAYKVVRDMLKSLDDPFTRFLDPDQYRSLQVNTSGELTGVGLQIALNSETGILEVITPIQGSPAQRAGLKPRDRILQIEGLSTENITVDEAAARMRGPIGTVLTLLIGREGQPNQEVVLVRDRIELNPVLSDLRLSSEGIAIGYIRLSQFNANAALE